MKVTFINKNQDYKTTFDKLDGEKNIYKIQYTTGIQVYRKNNRIGYIPPYVKMDMPHYIEYGDNEVLVLYNGYIVAIYYDVDSIVIIEN